MQDSKLPRLNSSTTFKGTILEVGMKFIDKRRIRDALCHYKIMKILISI